MSLLALRSACADRHSTDPSGQTAIEMVNLERIAVAAEVVNLSEKRIAVVETVRPETRSQRSMTAGEGREGWLNFLSSPGSWALR